MNREQLMAWSAGMLDGCGNLNITTEQGPTRKYHAITLSVAAGDAKGVERMINAAGNGEAHEQYDVWELRGFEAITGFLRDVWPLLLPNTRTLFNTTLKQYKGLKKPAS